MMFLFPTMCQFFHCVSGLSVCLWGDRVTPITLSPSSLFSFIYIFHSFSGLIYRSASRHNSTSVCPSRCLQSAVCYYTWTSALLSQKKTLIKPWTTHLINDYYSQSSNYLFIIPKPAIRSSFSPLMNILKGKVVTTHFRKILIIHLFLDIFIRIVLIINSFWYDRHTILVKEPRNC